MKSLQLISPKGKIEAEFALDPRQPAGECKLLRTVTMQVAATRIVEIRREVNDA